MHIVAKKIDSVGVAGTGLVVDNLTIEGDSRLDGRVRMTYNLSDATDDRSCRINNVNIIYRENAANERHTYSISMDTIVCQKTYAAIDADSCNIEDDIYAGGDLAIVGVSVFSANNLNPSLVSSFPANVVDLENLNPRGHTAQYLRGLSYIFRDDLANVRDFRLSRIDTALISRDSPLIVTFYISPVRHYVLQLDKGSELVKRNGPVCNSPALISGFPVRFIKNRNLRQSDGNPVLRKSGATTQRPSLVPAGFLFYDTDLKKPIWFDGSQWKDASGEGV